MQRIQRPSNQLTQHELIPHATNESELERIETIYIPKFEDIRQTASNRYGTLLREIREREGLSQSELASYLKVEEALIKDLEAGSKRIYRDVHNLDLEAVPGFTDSDWLDLWTASYRDIEDDTEQNFTLIKFRIKYVENQPYYGFLLKHKVLEYSLYLRAGLSTDVAKAIESNAANTIRAAHSINQNFIARYWNHFSNAFTEEAQVILLRLSDVDVETYDIILAQSTSTTVKNGEHLTSPTPDPHGDPNTAQGTNAPELGLQPDLQQPSSQPEQYQPAPKKGVVFEPRHAKLLFEALENPDHEYRQAAEQAVRGFAEVVEQPVGGALNPEQSPQALKKEEIYEEGQPPKAGAAKAGAARTYEVVATLRQAADKTGIERDEILTTRDIEDEYNINKKLVHEYTRRGREGRPHLTPLSVRLSGGRGGQLLFRREDIEKLVANPPKPGPPKKATIYEEDQTPKTGTPETHERLITLAQASDISGVPVGTLSNYLHEGKLTRQGRQRSPAPGGGKVLIDQSELASFLSSRRPRGRPRKKPATGK
jgi:transcriptional regulator with XRE-family HTH domain